MTANVETLAKRIVALDLEKIEDLGNYLRDVHGISSFSPRAPEFLAVLPKRKPDHDVMELGDLIANLDLAQSKALSSCLSSYGLVPTTKGGSVIL